jgi:hypothetical protein
MAESVSSVAGHDHNGPAAAASAGSASAAACAAPQADGQVSLYDEHEDSCYAVAWSATDAWTFASASYDGRVAINHVPRNVKYRVIL